MKRAIPMLMVLVTLLSTAHIRRPRLPLLKAGRKSTTCSRSSRIPLPVQSQRHLVSRARGECPPRKEERYLETRGQIASAEDFIAKAHEEQRDRQTVHGALRVRAGHRQR